MTLEQLHRLADECPYDFEGAMSDLSLLDESFWHAGYLGTGGDLSVPTLLHAYRCGVFPWFNQGEPIAWWSPVERCIIIPSRFCAKKSLVRTAKRQTWTVSVNQAFTQAMTACSQPRADTDETWIGDDMIQAYTKLHELGVALSVEVWEGVPSQSELIGGLYGVSMGQVFCGESMFHRRTDASKIAFWALMRLCVKSGIKLVDCQLQNPHLMSLGADVISREAYLPLLHDLVKTPALSLLNEHKDFAVKRLVDDEW